MKINKKPWPSRPLRYEISEWVVTFERIGRPSADVHSYDYIFRTEY